jgi:FAD/FMN-containing dehydrogenase
MTAEQFADAPYLDPLDQLSLLLPGKVVAPGDAAWEDARTPWIVNVDQQPMAVVTVDDAQDVVTVVRYARDHGLSVAAQPGGHGSTRALDETILLRTRGLDGLQVDVDSRVARVGAGVKMGELLTALDGTGLTALSGSTPDTSVVGLSVGLPGHHGDGARRAHRVVPPAALPAAAGGPRAPAGRIVRLVGADLPW